MYLLYNYNYFVYNLFVNVLKKKMNKIDEFDDIGFIFYFCIKEGCNFCI